MGLQKKKPELMGKCGKSETAQRKILKSAMGSYTVQKEDFLLMKYAIADLRMEKVDKKG